MDGQIFIIGGAEVYTAYLPRLDELLVSEVFERHPGDTWFPDFASRFAQSETLERHPEFEVRRYFL